MSEQQSSRQHASSQDDHSLAIEAPPQRIRGILARLGPGVILAASIVGSGELIMTTKTAAQAGFWLLWLIIIGCVIKVFVQVEFGRYAISSGKTTMTALDEVPGPRWRANWILWYWLVMFVVSLAQLGGIVGGVGQALAMNLPLNGSFNRLLDEQKHWDRQAEPIERQLREKEASAIRGDDPNASEAARERIQQTVEAQLGTRPNWRSRAEFYWADDVWWSAIVALATVAILAAGRYAMIEGFSAVMVASFTLVTVFTVFALQSYADWAVRWSDLADGLSFRLPPFTEGMSRWTPLATALATFGIIGVGTNELITYPYWCLEKGYARFTGPRDESPEWAQRARGWIRVMRWDAMISMVIFTFATIAFYLLGAAVLHRQGLDPEQNEMISVLGEMYVPVFGAWAKWLFLFGAFAVLYSTFFVANAGHTRVASDAIRVFGVGARTDEARRWWIFLFCFVFPLFSLGCYVVYRYPVLLVAASGVMQAIMLPMLAGATLYYRYHRSDKRIAPGRLWDAMLWISALGMLVAGAWIAVTKLAELVARLLG
ncbi:MAG: Nramp family divalent metal transporter [Planctomycetota bacterium]